MKMPIIASLENANRSRKLTGAVTGRVGSAVGVSVIGTTARARNTAASAKGATVSTPYTTIRNCPAPKDSNTTVIYTANTPPRLSRLTTWFIQLSMTKYSPSMQMPVAKRRNHHAAGFTTMPCSRVHPQVSAAMPLKARTWPTRITSAGMTREPST